MASPGAEVGAEAGRCPSPPRVMAALRRAAYAACVLVLAVWVGAALWRDALADSLVVLVLAMLTVLGCALKLTWGRHGRQLGLLWTRCKTTAKCSILKHYSKVCWMGVVGVAVYVVVDVALSKPRQLIALPGIATILLFCLAFSTAPSKVCWRVVWSGLACQLVLGLLILRWSGGYLACRWVADRFTDFLAFSKYGAAAAFGDKYYLHAFAMEVMPDLIWFNAVVCLLEHYGVLSWVLGGVGAAVGTVMGTSPAESVVAVGNVFLGPNSAVLLVEPMVGQLSTSELHCLLAGGLATIAGGLLGFFVSIGVPASHLVAASVMSAPAALAASKLLVPEKGTHAQCSKLQFGRSGYGSGLEAFSGGAMACVPVVGAILASLISSLAMLEMLNSTLGWLALQAGLIDVSFETVCSFAFTPVALLMGVEWADCRQVARLIGIKTVLNEFVGFLELAQLIDNRNNGLEPAISVQSEVIATYALCGYSNIGTVGSMVAFLAALAPHRAGDISQVALRSLVAGTAACLMTATVAGLLYQAED